jgi:hypothetical protein
MAVFRFRSCPLLLIKVKVIIASEPANLLFLKERSTISSARGVFSSAVNPAEKKRKARDKNDR